MRLKLLPIVPLVLVLVAVAVTLQFRDAKPAHAANVQQMAAGTYHTCAIVLGGDVKCWGENSDGQLGDDSNTLRTTPVLVCPTSCEVYQVTQIGAGGSHTCAVFDSTSSPVDCWGDNSSGQLGDCNAGTDANYPQQVWADSTCTMTLLEDAVQVVGGASHSCALTTVGVGEVWCWGYDTNAQLGDGTAGSGRAYAQKVCHPAGCVSGDLTGIYQIYAGQDHTCARSLTTLYCWGYNGYGQLGNGGTTDSALPVAVSGLSGTATWVGAGANHTCAVISGGTIQCWGDNTYGQLGLNTTSGPDDCSGTPCSTSPEDVCADESCFSDLTGVAFVGGGYGHTCASTTSNGAKCWGWNIVGQLSDGNASFDSDTPRNVCVDETCSAAANNLQLGGGSVGAYHGCAIRLDGSARCAGYNEFGQLGVGTTTGPELCFSGAYPCSDTGVAVVGLTKSTPTPTATPTATALPVSSLVGDGTAGDCPDDTTAENCQVRGPHGMDVIGPSGSSAGQSDSAAAGVPNAALYYADTGNNAVMMVDPPVSTSTVIRVAGLLSDAGGTGGYGGDDGPADLARLRAPRDVYAGGTQSAARVYIADTNNCIVRVVLTDGTIKRVAGVAPTGGAPGTPQCGIDTNTTARSAKLNFPTGVTVDASGNLYIADRDNHCIRKVTTGSNSIVDGGSGETISAVVNSCGPTQNGNFGLGGSAPAAKLNRPSDIVFLNGDFFIADTNNHRVVRWELASSAVGSLLPFAGTGSASPNPPNLSLPASGLAADVNLNFPEAVDATQDRVFIADTKNDRILRVNALDGTVSDVFSSATTGTAVNDPAGVAVSTELLEVKVADTGGERIVTAGINPTGDRTGNFTPSVSCGILPGLSSIDWALPALLLGGIAVRRRLGGLFFRLLGAAGVRQAPRPTAA